VIAAGPSSPRTTAPIGCPLKGLYGNLRPRDTIMRSDECYEAEVDTADLRCRAGQPLSLPHVGREGEAAAQDFYIGDEVETLFVIPVVDVIFERSGFQAEVKIGRQRQRMLDAERRRDIGKAEREVAGAGPTPGHDLDSAEIEGDDESSYSCCLWGLPARYFCCACRSTRVRRDRGCCRAGPGPPPNSIHHPGWQWRPPLSARANALWSSA